MNTSSFIIALVASGLTLNEMLEQSGAFASIVVSTSAGFMFGLIAQSVV